MGSPSKTSVLLYYASFDNKFITDSRSFSQGGIIRYCYGYAF